MQVTIDLPDNLPLTELDLRREVAILLGRGCANALFQQNILLIERTPSKTAASSTTTRFFKSIWQRRRAIAKLTQTAIAPTRPTQLSMI